MVINKTIAGIFHIARAFLHRGKRFFFSKSRFYGATFQKGGSLDTWIYSKRYTYIICIQLGWFVGSTGLISHWLLGETLLKTCTPPYPLRASSWLWWYRSAIFQQRRGLARSEVSRDFIWKGRWSRKKQRWNPLARYAICHLCFAAKLVGVFLVSAVS